MIEYKCVFKDVITLKTRKSKFVAMSWYQALEKAEDKMKPNEFILELSVKESSKEAKSK